MGGAVAQRKQSSENHSRGCRLPCALCCGGCSPFLHSFLAFKADEDLPSKGPRLGECQVSSFHFLPPRGGGYAGAMNLALLLLPLLAFADVPGIPTAVDRPFDLATLSHREAQRLDGRPVRVRVELESLPGDAGGAVVYDCLSPD